MKDSIVKYYLPVFFSALPVAGVALFQNYNDPEWHILLIILLGIVFCSTLIIGTILYKYRDKWIQKKQQKLLNHKSFQPFKKNGFIVNNDGLLGTYSDYIIYLVTKKDDLGSLKWVEILILYNPKQNGQFILQRVIDELNKKSSRKFNFLGNSLKIDVIYTFRLPKYEKIKNLIDKGVILLKKNKIEPIYDIQNWNDITDELSERNLKNSKLRLK